MITRKKEKNEIPLTKIASFFFQAQLPGISLILPLCIFGGLAIISAFFALLLPETLYANMEQTIEAAEVVQLDYSVPCCKNKKSRSEVKLAEVEESLLPDDQLQTERVSSL